ncbi:MAG: ParB/RepB/Spo0J family partition protein [Lachnospiraceae bacterium]|uniref:ParB/RepB/Spo0J family partition protein n=1 Tax=Candidatus Weimeria bifida TaxID=2599074 RepID=A0A6N7J078_9FIRM|nr:ParB/RepB/Spo0J family partition protein [Candidatus Weimeria bifida]RRF96915.1 MAG: ParB/RepB/Spo0J family partition protein [Lachnospiraceae bacterium]
MARNNKHGLGKGLDSLIPDIVGNEEKKDESEKGPETLVDINKVEPNKEQPRKIFNEDALQELSDSIKQYGIIQPLLVRKKDDYYEIIAGERRWRAAKKAGLKKVPVVIRDMSEQEVTEVSLIENIQREDLNPIEEAQAYKRLLEEFNLKQDEVAEKVSKSRVAVTNSLRLLKLDKRVQDMLVEEMITPGHARALLNIDDPDKQYEFAQKIFDEKMSVRDVEREVKNLNQKKPVEPKKEKQKLDKEYLNQLKSIEENLKQKTGTKVLITPKDKNKGKIEINYFSNEEFEKLVSCLNQINKQ